METDLEIICAKADKDGRKVRLMVIRPECPKLALQFIELINRLQENGEMTNQQHEKAYQEMLSLQGYRVEGFLGRKLNEPNVGYVIQMRPISGGLESGDVVGGIQPGDSFVDEDSFKQWRNLSAELRDAQRQQQQQQQQKEIERNNKTT